MTNLNIVSKFVNRDLFTISNEKDGKKFIPKFEVGKDYCNEKITNFKLWYRKYKFNKEYISKV